jgi:hypothetical protein
MAKVVAEAIRDRGVTEARLCACHCGRLVTGKQVSATPACRKRLERGRVTPGPVTAAPWSGHLLTAARTAAPTMPSTSEAAFEPVASCPSAPIVIP